MPGSPLHKSSVHIELSGCAPVSSVGREREVGRRLADQTLFGSDYPFISLDRLFTESTSWNWLPTSGRPSWWTTRPGSSAHDPVAELPGRSALRTTGRVGLRRATSRNPARSYMDFAPKNMKSGWLRSSLSTG